MPKASQIILSTTYLGPISWYARMIQAEHVLIDLYEHYSKQTYRNRCRITTANGIQNLTIPVVKVNGNHTHVKDIEISYYEKWPQNHWRSITAAYNNSPFFLYYSEELEQFYHKKFKLLSEFNDELMRKVIDLLEMKVIIENTSEYIEEVAYNNVDLRNAYSPKLERSKNFPEYYQVFLDKNGFFPDMSILDLLFNLGPGSLSYLLKL